MSHHDAISELRSKVAQLCTEPLSDGDFVAWLRSYADRAAFVLSGNAQHCTTPSTEVERRDLLREFARFQSSTEVVAFANKHGILLAKGEFWWFLNPDERPAHIVGFEHKPGVPRITNGIDVWLEMPDGSLFLGHRDWLVYHRKPSQRSSASEAEQTPVKADKRWTELARKIYANDVDVFAAAYAAKLGKAPIGLCLDTEEEAIATISVAVGEYMDAVTSI